MSGGHGIWEPLEGDPEIVFSWGFETGNHGFRKTITPIRNYWEQYFRVRKCMPKGKQQNSLSADYILLVYKVR